jgi:hypothetical protein
VREGQRRVAATGPVPAVTVGPCGPDDVVALRHAVLRPHTTVEHATFAEDSYPATAHFCARDEAGSVVCVATVWPEAPPWPAGDNPLSLLPPGPPAAPGTAARSGDAAQNGAVAPHERPAAPRGLARSTPGEAWRLRAMATHPQWRGRGVGAAVVRAVTDHVAAQGGSLLWCNARLGARRFYERAGLTTWGEVWQEPVIGPHVVMYKRVATRRSG